MIGPGRFRSPILRGLRTTKAAGWGVRDERSRRLVQAAAGTGGHLQPAVFRVLIPPHPHTHLSCGLATEENRTFVKGRAAYKWQLLFSRFHENRVKILRFNGSIMGWWSISSRSAPLARQSRNASGNCFVLKPVRSEGLARAGGRPQVRRNPDRTSTTRPPSQVLKVGGGLRVHPAL